jgi:hypothetical protein
MQWFVLFGGRVKAGVRLAAGFETEMGAIENLDEAQNIVRKKAFHTAHQDSVRLI